MKMSKFKRLAIENIKDIACEIMDISYDIYVDLEIDDASEDLEELAKRLMDIYQMLRPEDI